MKQYFTLDLFRATLLSLLLSFFSFSLSFSFFPLSLFVDLPLRSKLLGEHCLHELHYKRNGRINFLPLPEEIERLPQIFAQTY